LIYFYRFRKIRDISASGKLSDRNGPFYPNAHSD
jgi:hypothetical protein